MDRNSYLRTNFIPMSHATLGYVPATTVSSSHQNQSTKNNTIQNITFDNGMMTIRVPITQFQQLNQMQQSSVLSFVNNKSTVSRPIVNTVSSIKDSSNFNIATSLSASSSSSSIPSQANWESGGVIIVDNTYLLKTGQNCQAIFLGLNPTSGKYELFYGKRDLQDLTPVNTCLRECTEETANLFRFSEGMFDESFKVTSHNNKHQAYVIRVEPPKLGIQSKLFFHNIAQLKSNKAPYCWNEISNITRINIEEAIITGILRHYRGDFQMFDVYGNPITIFSRDAEFISDALRKKLNLRAPVHQLKFVSSYNSSFHGGANSFLNGTKYYTL